MVKALQRCLSMLGRHQAGLQRSDLGDADEGAQSISGTHRSECQKSIKLKYELHFKSLILRVRHKQNWNIKDVGN